MPARQNDAVQITNVSDSILLMTLDMPDKGANILSAEMFDQLEAAIEPHLARNEIEGLILYSGKPKIFVAGADLHAISAGLDWPDERIIAFCERGREVMSKFNQAPFVTVAAIHGACVGGGFELTLWCDCRVATDDRRTRIGLPEVKLGLIPGWAGTVRVARLAGIEPQLELVTSARLLTGVEAKELGLVDAVVAQDNLIDQAVQLIESKNIANAFMHDRKQIDLPLEPVEAEGLTRKYVERITAPANPLCPVAPLIALEHMLRAASLPIHEAYRSESLAFAEAWGSEPSYGLLHNFFLNDFNKKHPGWSNDSVSARDVNSVGIIGAGVMGVSIAKANLKRKKQVRLFDVDANQSAAAAAQLSPDSPETIQAESLERLGEIDLAIEAVTESASAKLQVLAELEQQVDDRTIIASNTSAIPIGDLAAALKDPARFCGIHFCHPELMSLVELIPATRTSQETIATALGYIRSLGKMAIVVQDRAGFAVNRLLATMLKGAFELLSQGHSISRIDRVMREFGFRGGPFEIVDVIGLDTCVLAGRAMWNAGLRVVTDSPIPARMVKIGRLGRKTGAGFYRYEQPRGLALLDPEVDSLIRPYLRNTTAELGDDEIVLQILTPMVAEARQMLAEGVVQDARDLDIASIHGFSFPDHQGGLLYWAERAEV